MHLLADHDRVGGIAAATADRLGEAGTEQARLGGLAMQVAGEIAGALPLVDVGGDLPFDEGAHGLAQVLALGGGPDAHSAASPKNFSGMSR